MIETRAITEIEEQILDGIARIVCRELGLAWQALALEVRFEERLGAGEAQRLMPPQEKTLSLSFEITMPNVRGGLSLAVPATVSNALLRKISADWSHRKPRASSDSRARLMQLLLDCPFTAELSARELGVSVGLLANLAPGNLLGFSRPAAEPASLLIAGVETFCALPSRCGSTRTARVVSPAPLVSQPPPDTKEK